jgi:hypothetical protein
MALMKYWLPTWPRMRAPNRAVLPEHRVQAPAAGAALETESYPAETDPPAKPEKGKVEE